MTTETEPEAIPVVEAELRLFADYVNAQEHRKWWTAEEARLKAEIGDRLEYRALTLTYEGSPVADTRYQRGGRRVDQGKLSRQYPDIYRACQYELAASWRIYVPADSIIPRPEFAES